MPDYELNIPSGSDADALRHIESECFSIPLTAEQIAAQIRDERFILICARNRKEEIVAYAGMYHVLDEGYITNVAVLPEARRLHAADALMEKLEQLSAEMGLSFISLEVRESNTPAISLYKKHGYETAGIRKNYYQFPKENALIMTKKLSEEKN